MWHYALPSSRRRDSMRRSPPSQASSGPGRGARLNRLTSCFSQRFAATAAIAGGHACSSRLRVDLLVQVVCLPKTIAAQQRVAVAAAAHAARKMPEVFGVSSPDHDVVRFERFLEALVPVRCSTAYSSIDA